MPIQPLSLKARALRLLGMREHSRAELAQKLARHVQEGEDLEAVLDWLAAKDFLNEARAAEAIVHRQAARHGSARVKQTLRQKGVPDELIEASMAGLQDTEQARALAVWQPGLWRRCAGRHLARRARGPGRCAYRGSGKRISSMGVPSFKIER
jgi:regulatory protein